ncbi:hypothetical protein HCJ40_13740 [Listeria sp. FSL L7-0993]|uniref:hypothetical protein n=1 Tax=Listeria cossartiae TaxID=2838249 RepID=UPI00162825C5|nr:hypothetical protein [Listeria cossartiae]MBC1808067.1 hypothetical protein [Listeria cossartiae subsp. cayugensis]
MEIGSLADWFSAVGTIGAVVLSLTLLVKDSKRKLQVYVRTQNKSSSEKEGVVIVYGEIEYVFWAVNNTNKFYQVRWGGMRIYEDTLINKIRYNFLEINRPSIYGDITTLYEGDKLEILNTGQVSKEKVITSREIDSLIEHANTGKRKIIEFIYLDANNNEYSISMKV